MKTRCYKDITEIVEHFYGNLHASAKPQLPNIQFQKQMNVDSEEIPDISIDEIKNALSQMRSGRATGEDSITTDIIMMKLGDTIIVAVVTE